MEGLAGVLQDVRTVATNRPSRHPTLLSALCWREVGAGAAKQWYAGGLVDAGVVSDLPAAGESRAALPRGMDEVSGRVRDFIERIEALIFERRNVLALLGGVDLIVPLDPPSLRLPFGADPAEIGASALAARAMFLCGPWLVGGDEGRSRLGASLFIAAVVAEADGTDEIALDAAEHLAAAVMQDVVVRSGGRGRSVEFAF